MRKSQDRQQNDQMNKDKKSNNDLHNIKHKTKDRVTRTPAGALRCSGRVNGSCPTSGTRRVTLNTNLMISHEWGKDRKCLRQVEHIRNRNLLEWIINIWWQVKENEIVNVLLYTEKFEDTKGVIRCFGRESCPCFTFYTYSVTLVTNAVINQEWGKDMIEITTTENYLVTCDIYRYSGTANTWIMQLSSWHVRNKHEWPVKFNSCLDWRWDSSNKNTC
jgi:hypothetical protein